MKSVISRESRSDYTVKEWLAIFEESAKKEELTHLQFIATSLLEIQSNNYDVDDFIGFCFLETLAFITNPGNNEHLNSSDIEIISSLSLSEKIPSEFNTLSTISCSHELIKNKLDYDLYGYPHLDYDIIAYNLAAGITDIFKYDEDDDTDGLWFKGERIAPELNSVENYKRFFAALIYYYDQFISSIGQEEYDRLLNMVINEPVHEFEVNY